MTNLKFAKLWKVLLSKITSSQFQYKKIITFGAAAFLLSAGLLIQKRQSKDSLVTSSLAFKKNYDLWISKAQIDEKTLIDLSKHLKKLPELTPLFQWKIIQQCLLLGDSQSARSLLKETSFFKSRLDNIYYHRFSEISFFISSKEYEKAYEESLLLKQDLLSDASFWEKQHYVSYGSDLFAYNLVRIAFLSKFLGKKELELSAWAEVKKYSYTNTGSNSLHPFIDFTACEKLISSFAEEGISLHDYIKHRESFLKKS